MNTDNFRVHFLLLLILLSFFFSSRQAFFFNFLLVQTTETEIYCFYPEIVIHDTVAVFFLYFLSIAKDFFYFLVIGAVDLSIFISPRADHALVCYQMSNLFKSFRLRLILLRTVIFTFCFYHLSAHRWMHIFFFFFLVTIINLT